MIGVVDVGGGLRGVYGAGVFDTCLDEGIAFDYLIGVSAGSANVASFLAGQKGRNLKFYADYSFRKAYMSFRNLLRRGSYLDLDYIYGDALTNAGGEYPLDYQAMAARPETAKIVATDVATGQPVYFDFHDMAQDDYGAIKASCCVPVVNRPYRWRGKAYYDGGLSDPIPFQQAFQAGCDRVVVILTKPRSFVRKPEKMLPLIQRRYREYPNFCRTMEERPERDNRDRQELFRLEREGKALVIAPNSLHGVGRIEHNVDKLRMLWAEGYQQGMENMEQIRSFMGR